MSRRVHSPGSFFLCDDGNEGIVAYGADGIMFTIRYQVCFGYGGEPTKQDLHLLVRQATV